jgi:hypothetical protein
VAPRLRRGPGRVHSAIRKREQYIGQLEILGAVAVYYSLPEIFVNQKVLHFIDNTSAVAGLLRGYSAVEDSARIVHAFWALATGLGLVAYFEYVKSSANIADAPSRGKGGARLRPAAISAGHQGCALRRNYDTQS